MNALEKLYKGHELLMPITEPQCELLAQSRVKAVKFLDPLKKLYESQLKKGIGFPITKVGCPFCLYRKLKELELFYKQKKLTYDNRKKSKEST